VILAACQGAHPAEVCGLVGTRHGILDSAYPVPNVAEATPGRCGFLMDSQGQFRAMCDLKDAGHELGAIYHSHPHTPAIPSEADIALAAYPEAVHLVVGLREVATPDVRVWRIADGRSEELMLRIASELPDAAG
jgi:proteasome lid subunit RPN8/RPN11